MTSLKTLGWFVQHLPYEVVVFTESGEIDFANQEFLDHSGYKSVDQLTIYDLNPNTNENTWRNHWEKVKGG